MPDLRTAKLVTAFEHDIKVLSDIREFTTVESYEKPNLSQRRALENIHFKSQH